MKTRTSEQRELPNSRLHTAEQLRGADGAPTSLAGEANVGPSDKRHSSGIVWLRAPRPSSPIKETESIK